MNSLKTTCKRFFVTILTFVMVFSMTPQLPMLDSAATVTAATVKLSKKKLALKVGKTKKLTLKNASGKIKWKTSNKKVATVSKKGLVKAKCAGKATITAIYKSKKYKCTVTIKAVSTSNGNSNSNTTDNSNNTQPIVSTVYWVPSGSVYHVSRNCPTLSRSKTILSGSITNSGKPRVCKVCSK